MTPRIALPMPRTLRVRLALWYAVVLFTVLGTSAIVAWAGFAGLTLAQVDEELRDFASAIGGTLRHEMAQRHASEAEDVANAVGELGFSDLAVAVRDSATGAVSFAAVPAMPGDETPREAVAVSRAAPVLEAELARATDGQWAASGPRTVHEDGDPLRIVLEPVHAGGRAIMLAVAHPLLRRDRLLADVAAGFAVGIPVVLLLASGGGWWLARKGLAPVVAMSQQARRMGAATLHERLPVAADDELGDLATTFNELLQRLDAAFEQQRRFLADASHELRTPVAILGGEAQHALARADRGPDELRAALTVVRDETRRLERIVADLFLLARGDAREQPLVPGELYLDEVVADAVRGVRTLAVAKGVQVECAPCDEELACRGDEPLLRRLVLNLLDNAVKYTPAGGRVVASSFREGGVLVVEVSDTGVGVPPDAHDRIFDRFYRVRQDRAVDAVRTSDAAALAGTGAGLGLAIARWIAEAHGGSLVLARSGRDGSTFRFTMPAHRTDVPGTTTPSLASTTITPVMGTPAVGTRIP